MGPSARKKWLVAGAEAIFIGLCLAPTLIALREDQRRSNFVMQADVSDVWRGGMSRKTQKTMGAYASASEGKIRKALSSPTADSLAELLGTWKIKPALATGMLYAGRYDVRSDTAELSTEVFDMLEFRMAWIHELAHALQAREGKAFGDTWRDIKSPEEIVYAARSINEHQAEAVALAILWLQASGDKKADREEMIWGLEQSNELVPGTVLMVRWWLTHPLYSQHPWQKNSLVWLQPVNPPWAWAELKERENWPLPGRLANYIAAQKGPAPFIMRGVLGAIESVER